jgi:hypothetical protein
VERETVFYLLANFGIHLADRLLVAAAQSFKLSTGLYKFMVLKKLDLKGDKECVDDS